MLLEPDKAILNVKEFVVNDTVTSSNFDELKNSLYIQINNVYSILPSDATFDNAATYYNVNWIEIPAIKGSSVQVTNVSEYESGTQIDLFDEATHTTNIIQLPYGKSVHATVASSSVLVPDTDPSKYRWIYNVSIVDDSTASSYNFTLYDGVDGTGKVNFVDHIPVNGGEGQAYASGQDIPLKAVSYGRIQELSSADQSVARDNINAQVKGSYINAPATPTTNQLLSYNGTTWIASWPIPVAAPSNTLLMKTSASGAYGVAWISAMSTAAIDALFS